MSAPEEYRTAAQENRSLALLGLWLFGTTLALPWAIAITATVLTVAGVVNLITVAGGVGIGAVVGTCGLVPLMVMLWPDVRPRDRR